MFHVAKWWPGKPPTLQGAKEYGIAYGDGVLRVPPLAGTRSGVYKIFCIVWNAYNSKMVLNRLKYQ